MIKSFSNQQGRLKIFFGMCSGVGKTYTMLEQAQNQRKEGTHVVVGIVNTHGRVETSELLKNLKIIPLKWFNYNNRAFEGLDVDAIIQLKPQIVLIDELEHVNLPGSRHANRWQDVSEILEAGIDVYTTLNVQNIESRKEVVENITGLQIQETVPDLFFERASDIELIDITPDDLLQRLKEGKVYLGELPRQDIEKFFREESLIALREIALRMTAEKIDHELHGINQEWKTKERLMVAVSHNPHSQRLIRAARTLAFEMDAQWVAVHVDTDLALSDAEQANLMKNLSLAHDLGAEVVTIADIDLVNGLQRVTKQKSITQLLIGRPRKQKILHYFKKNFIDKLIEATPNVDIVILRHDLITELSFKALFPHRQLSPLIDYGYAVLSSFFTLLISYIATPWLGYHGIGIIFIANILFLSFFAGRGPIFLAAVLNGIFWNFILIPPSFEFKLGVTEDSGLLIIYLLVALVVGMLSSRVRENERLLNIREENAEFLFEIEKVIVNASSIAILKEGIIVQLKKLFKGDFDFLIKNKENQLSLVDSLPLLKDEKEENTAFWVFNHSKIAGWSTDTLPQSRGIYFPIRGLGETVGVMVFLPKYFRPLSNNEMSLLQTVNQQVGTFIQRALLKEKTSENIYSQEAQKAQKAIFSSFSYNINVPVLKIEKNIESLKQEVSEIRKEFLIKQTEKNLAHLKELLDNVLTMSKLSTGLMQFVKIEEHLEIFLKSVLLKFKDSWELRTFETKLPSDAVKVNIDKELMSIALSNLITNAIEYSPISSPIVLEAQIRDKQLIISVLDEGPGIPAHILPHIFEKFYQADVPGVESTGLGLGLSVTRVIVEMHQGKLQAANRSTGGAEFSLIIPLASI